MKKLFVFMLAVLMAVTMMIGCGKEKEPEQPAKEVLNVGLNSNIVGLDPLNGSSNGARAYAYAVFEPLIEYDHEGTNSKYTPCLATEWSVADDNMTWTFKLREGIKFHNGEPFTSADVVATYTRLLNEKSLNVRSSYWTYLDSVEAVDDYTVKIKTTQPFATTLISVAMTPIMPDEAMAEFGEDFWNAQKLYGTGPWKFVEWVDGAYLHLVKNDEYWNKSAYDPAVKDLYFRFLTEVSTAITSHISGDLDAYIVNGGISRDLQSMYKGHDEIELITTETQNWIYLGYHCAGDSAFADYYARAAVDYALNRQLICDTIFSGDAKLSNGVVLPSLDGYDPTIPAYEYNPEKAKELLAKSNYDGHEITIYTSTSLAKGKDQILEISQELNAVGFNTKAEAIESAKLTEIRKAGNYEVFLMNDNLMGADLSKYLSMKVLTDAHKHEYDNPEMMELVDKILTELDIPKRNEMLGQFVRMMRETSAPHTVLYYLVQTEAINKGVVGIEMWKDTMFSVKYIDYDPAKAK